ncbi:MAG: hypothetical protein ACI9JN_001481 [Bacteroidia bacterium]
MFFYTADAQHTFDYSVKIKPTSFAGLPGLHSYVHCQTDSKWLFIGGRKDGLHARQPFAAFQTSGNKDSIFVADVKKQSVWSVSLTSLSTDLQEQLQSTNMNFHQIEDTLYIIGGYAYSPTAQDHVTFPFLTTVQVSSLIDDIINGRSITNNFK